MGEMILIAGVAIHLAVLFLSAPGLCADGEQGAAWAYLSAQADWEGHRRTVEFCKVCWDCRPLPHY